MLALSWEQRHVVLRQDTFLPWGVYVVGQLESPVQGAKSRVEESTRGRRTMSLSLGCSAPP